MIATIISVVLLIIALYKYSQRNYEWPLIIYAFLVTNGFILSFGEPPTIKFTDLGLVFLTLSCLMGYNRDKRFFSIKEKEGGKLVVLYLGFMVLEAIYTIIIGADSINGIITILRPSLNTFAYFVFRKIPLQELYGAIKKVFQLAIFVCVLFVIQFITHIELINTYVSESNEEVGNYRMQVTPPFISYILLYLLCYNIKSKYKWLVVALITVVMLISQNRTPIIGIVLQIGIFLLLSKNVKRKFTIMILGLLTFPFVSSMFESRAEEGSGQSNFDIPAWHYLERGDYIGLARTSTFMFRIALTAERFEYIMKHPDKTLLGVGAIDQNSQKVKQFKFSVGTAFKDPQTGRIEISQLNSIDVLWGPLIIRYGLLGLVLHIYIMAMSGWQFYKEKNNRIMMIGFLTMVAAFAQSFSSGGFFGGLSLFTLSVFWIVLDKIQYTRKLKKQKICKNIN